jgi:hypothetical protein
VKPCPSPGIETLEWILSTPHENTLRIEIE